MVTICNTAGLREKATLDTRQSKKQITGAELLEKTERTLKEHDLSIEKIHDLTLEQPKNEIKTEGFYHNEISA